MPIPRMHLIELHEQPWFPATWRRLFQRGLGRGSTLMGAYENAAPLLERVLRRAGARSVIDLCSGSAEPILALRERLADELKPAVVLSDLYPNDEEIERVKARCPGVIDYFPHPVDARRVPADAPRVRTIFGALHHFPPDEVRAILRDAAENADGFAAFESTGRTWLHMALLLPLPLFSAAATAFALRPIRARNVVWGALLPVIPAAAVIDGLVSNLRTYTVEELEGFTRDLGVPGFAWEAGQIDIARVSAKTTYLIGWRTHPRG